MTYNLKEKVVLVTGATSGIGKAIAILYAKHGASVMLAGRSEQKGQALKEEIAAFNGTAEFMKVELGDPNECKSLIDRTLSIFGTLDIACNNAGIGGVISTVADYPLDVWHDVIQINLNSVFYCMKYELQAMLGKEHPGVIINMGSVFSQVGSPFQSGYNTAKHAILGLTKSAALEYATAGIRINAVGPGYVDTPLLDPIPSAIKDTLGSHHPIGRMCTAEEVAELVIWLSSDNASFVTGAFYPIDGGYLAR